MKKLKPVLPNLDGIAEHLQEFYTQRGDGKWYLDLEGEPAGYVPKAQLDEFRTSNLSLKEQLEQIKGAALSEDELTEYRALKESQQKNKDQKLIDEGKIEELFNARTEALRKDYEHKYGALNKKHEDTTLQLNEARNQLSGVLIDSAVSKSISNVGQVRKGAFTDVINRAKSTWKYQDNNLVAVDGEGHPIYSKDGKTLISMEEWCQGLAEQAPYFFESSQGSGSQGSQSNQQSNSNVSVIPRSDNKAFINNIEAIAKGTVRVANE